MAKNADLLPGTLDMLILKAVSLKPLHGYGVILAVQELTEGVIVMRTGTLYVLLRRLLDQRLIEQSDERPDSDEDDERRRYYRISALGRKVARGEAERLAALVKLARASGFAPGKA